MIDNPPQQRPFDNPPIGRSFDNPPHQRSLWSDTPDEKSRVGGIEWFVASYRLGLRSSFFS